MTHLINNPEQIPEGTIYRVIGVQLAFWDNRTLIEVKEPIAGIEEGPTEYPNGEKCVDDGFDRQNPWETKPAQLPDTSEADAIELLTKLNEKNPEAVSRAIAATCAVEQLESAVSIKAETIGDLGSGVKRV